MHLGSYLRIDKFTYATEKMADVFGDWEDQPPGYAVFTIVSNSRTLRLVSDKSISYLSQLGGNARSGLYVALSQTAIQMRFFCDEVRIEDVIDFYITGALAIKGQQDSTMILGQSYTQAVEPLERGEPYRGKVFLPAYWNREIRMVKVNVEEKLGPFKREKGTSLILTLRPGGGNL
jgi:hypothetical protein